MVSLNTAYVESGVDFFYEAVERNMGHKLLKEYYRIGHAGVEEIKADLAKMEALVKECQTDLAKLNAEYGSRRFLDKK